MTALIFNKRKHIFNNLEVNDIQKQFTAKEWGAFGRGSPPSFFLIKAF